MVNVLAVYKACTKYPFGKTIFSYVFSAYAPYFLNIRAKVHDLRPGYAEVSMKQRWAVQNHIKTIHAISVCNLIEMTMGLVAESSIPSHLRWLPMGMNVEYLKKNMKAITATAQIDEKTFFNLDKYPGKVGVPVNVKNEAGEVTTAATVFLWISEKPKKTIEDAK